jgi:hypothetical protein
MQLRWIHTALFVSLVASGCELVADFDRSKIPSDRPDTGVTMPPPNDDDDEHDRDEDDGGMDASAPSDNSDDGGSND